MFPPHTHFQKTVYRLNMNMICSFGGWYWIRMLFILNLFWDVPRLFSVEIMHLQYMEIAFGIPVFARVVVLTFWMGRGMLGTPPMCSQLSIRYSIFSVTEMLLLELWSFLSSIPFRHAKMKIKIGGFFIIIIWTTYDLLDVCI